MALSMRASHFLFSTSGKKQFSLPVFFSSSSSLGTSDQNPECETLISSVVSILKEQRSKSRWNFIKTLYPNGFSTKEVSEITIRMKNNPRLALRFFLWSEKRSLCTHDLLSYCTIIHILARSRLKDMAQTLIETAIRVSEVGGTDGISSKPPKIFETLTKTYRYCDSAPFVFDLLIKACLQMKKIDRAVEVVRMLRSQGIFPTIGTCNMLLRAVSQSRGSDACLSMHREIFSLDIDIANRIKAKLFPNVQTLNTLMLAFYQDGMMEKVEEIWVDRVGGSCDCYPNVCSYSVLLAVYCDQRKMDEAMGLWEEMRVKQIKADAVAYNTLIKGFCENQEMDKAEQIFRQMALDQIESTCVTLEYLIRGYCKVGDVDSALILYKDLCRTKEFRPESSTVEEVIRALCEKDRISYALTFFRDIIGKHGLAPSASSFQYLITGLCKEGKMEDALMLQTEMVGSGFEPNVEIYKSFIYGYNKQGNEEKSRALTKEMFDFDLQQNNDGQ